MALIKCPECKKKISDRCEKCPQCGYPINQKIEDQNLEIENTENVEVVATVKKPFYKKAWVWIVAGVVLVALIVGAILLLNRDTKPKFDKDGNPVFVEMTNEVYTNAKEYLGYHVKIKGQVFQVMSDNGSTKGIQIWLDPDTCEQNLMIYYSTDAEVKQGDYIMCSGYIDSVTEYKNVYDAKLYAPVVYSSDLKKATYIDVMAPTTATIIPENLKQEKYGYSISIDKIEFAEKETRVYATATNNGKAVLNVGEAVIVQDGKQYNSEDNYDAEYDEIPYEIVEGVSCSGIIVFPAINIDDFELTISAHSEDFDEELDEFVFKVLKDRIVQDTEENNSAQNAQSNQTTSKTTGASKEITFEGGVCSQIDAWGDGMPTDNKTEFVDGETVRLAGRFIGVNGRQTLKLVWKFPNGKTQYDLWEDIKSNEAWNIGYSDCGIGVGSVEVIHEATGKSLAFFEFIFYENDIPTALEPTDYVRELYDAGYSREEIIQDLVSSGTSREDAEKIVNDSGIQ